MKVSDQGKSIADRRVREVSELGAILDRLKPIHDITGLSGWSAIDEWLGRELHARVMELANLSTGPDRTQQIRGEIAALTAVRNLPKATLAEIKEVSTRAAGLRDQIEQWHNAGRSDLRPAVTAAEQLVQRTNQ